MYAYNTILIKVQEINIRQINDSSCRIRIILWFRYSSQETSGIRKLMLRILTWIHLTPSSKIIRSKWGVLKRNPMIRLKLIFRRRSRHQWICCVINPLRNVSITLWMIKILNNCVKKERCRKSSFRMSRRKINKWWGIFLPQCTVRTQHRSFWRTRRQVSLILR